MSDKLMKFIDCIVPVSTCNLRCRYCYVTLKKKFGDKLPTFPYTAEHMGQALSRERMGGACCINLCGGGETLLPPEMTGIIREILKQGHYLMIVTNGTVSKRFDEIIQLPPEYLERLFFKFSFQYLELKRLKIFDLFFSNIEKIRKAGCSFSLELTPSDEEIPHIEDIKKMSLEKASALCHVTVARDTRQCELPILTDLSRNIYKKTWGQFNSELFRYKLSVFNRKRKEFCYAGAWTYFLNIGSGDLKQCYNGKLLQNIFADLVSPIKEEAVGCFCPEPHCFNAHGWLTFGAIPGHRAPTYAEVRDRERCDGSHWLTLRVNDFFSQKLENNNREYTALERRAINKAAHPSHGFTYYSDKLLAKISVGKIRRYCIKKFKGVMSRG